MIFFSFLSRLFPVTVLLVWLAAVAGADADAGAAVVAVRVLFLLILCLTRVFAVCFCVNQGKPASNARRSYTIQTVYIKGVLGFSLALPCRLLFLLIFLLPLFYFAIRSSISLYIR